MTLVALALVACNGADQTNGGPIIDSSEISRTETAALPRFQGGHLIPESLKGLASIQVEDALGAPSFRRRDPPAEIWQYRVKSCTLDLFLYEEKNRLTVAHYAVRSPSGTQVSDRACLDEVLAQRNGRPVS